MIWITVASPIISFLTMIVTIISLIYTNKRFDKTMLDNLDSKSGWRKTLFEIAGKDRITLEDVFKIRACLRFDSKKDHKIFLIKKQMKLLTIVMTCKRFMILIPVKMEINVKVKFYQKSIEKKQEFIQDIY